MKDHNVYELELLLKQRKTIYKRLQCRYKALGSIATAIITSNVLLTALSSIGTININLTPFISYVFVQVLIFFALIIVGILFAANNDRQYISAIDRRLFDEYDITSLVLGGELSKFHVTGITGILPSMMILLGISAIVFSMFVITISPIGSMILQVNLSFVIALCIQILWFIIILLSNFIQYKIRKKSSVEEDCYQYLSRKH